MGAFSKQLREVAVSLFGALLRPSVLMEQRLSNVRGFVKFYVSDFCLNLSTRSIFGSYETKSDASHADLCTV